MDLKKLEQDLLTDVGWKQLIPGMLGGGKRKESTAIYAGAT